MRYCVLDTNNKCVNVIELDNEDQFNVENLTLAPNNSGEIGWTWNTDQWINPNVITTEMIAINKRNIRNVELKRHVDTLNPIRWNAMTQEQQQAWIDYRQALLDVPEQSGWPTVITWPVKPE